jgi:HPt (histidine-containing phosphotransfer) domain-containing protein
MDSVLTNPYTRDDLIRSLSGEKARTGRLVLKNEKPSEPWREAMGDSPAVSEKYLRDLLAGLSASTRMAGRLSELFGRESEQRVSDLGAAIRAGDRHACKRLAHALKGGSSSLGASRLAALAAWIEARSEEGEAAFSKVALNQRLIEVIVREQSLAVTELERLLSALSD